MLGYSRSISVLLAHFFLSVQAIVTSFLCYFLWNCCACCWKWEICGWKLSLVEFNNPAIFITWQGLVGSLDLSYAYLMLIMWDLRFSQWSVKIKGSWDVTPCGLIYSYWRFGGCCCVHMQVSRSPSPLRLFELMYTASYPSRL
jgi:hypothetical protein